jgi:ribosomal protein S18 acetylase RimI-like enzyme
MDIRPMKDGDVATVARLYLDAYGVEWSEDGAKSYIDRFYRFEPASCLVVGEDDGRVSGAILAYSFEKESGLVLFIQELCVHPEFRSKGYGKALVTKLRESLSRRPKYVKVKPLVKADTGVLNFYNSLGFEKDKVVTFSLDIE